MQTHPSAAVSELAKVLGEQWRALGAEESAVWKEKASEDKTRYEAELAEFREKYGDTVDDRMRKERQAQKPPKREGRSAGRDRKRPEATVRPSAETEQLRMKLEGAAQRQQELARSVQKVDKRIAKLSTKRAELYEAADSEERINMLSDIKDYESQLLRQRAELDQQVQRTDMDVHTLADKLEQQQRADTKRQRAESGAAKSAIEEASKSDLTGANGAKATAEKPSVPNLNAASLAKPATEKPVIDINETRAGESAFEKRKIAGEVLQSEGSVWGHESNAVLQPKRLKKTYGLEAVAIDTVDDQLDPPDAPAIATIRGGDGSDMTKVVDQHVHELGILVANDKFSESEVEPLLAFLESTFMTYATLSKTGAGKMVNKVRKVCPTLQVRARNLMERWKSLAVD